MNALPSLYEKFEVFAREAFCFLENDYGFKLVKTVRDRFTAFMLYQNLTTGIEIEFDPRENQIWLMLYRLIDGQLPKYDRVSDLDHDMTNRFDLDTLLEFKAPHLLATQKGQRIMLSEHDMQASLVEIAAALRQYGEGILTGDFADFVDLGRLKQERLRKMQTK
jgi:hypothetical protein